MGKVKRDLAGHFTEEERQVHEVGAIKATPHLAASAASLQSDHADLLSRLERLAEQLAACPPAFSCWSEAMSELDAFLSRLEQHERQEETLWQEALGTDRTQAD